MRIYGTIYVAMHGPVKLLRQAAEFLEGGRYEEAEAVREHLLAETKGADGEEIAVAYWEDFRDSNRDLRGYLETLEAVAQTVTGLDIAVAEQTSNTITDGHSYHSYYSPAGSNTLNTDDFENYCQAQVISAAVQLQVVDHTGNKRGCDLYDEDEWVYSFFDEDAELIPEDSDYMYEVACEQVEGVPLLLRKYEEEDGEIVLEVAGDPKDLVPNQDGKIVKDEFDWKTFESVTTETDVVKISGVQWSEIESCFLVRIDKSQKEPEYAQEQLEKIVKYLRVLYPDDDLRGELCKGRPYIYGKDGAEWFPGSMAILNDGSEKREVHWNFPKEAKEWIPIPTEF